MRKLNKKQKSMIDTFINNNKSGGLFLPCSVIDNGGMIENVNNYDGCWSDIERYYTDTKQKETYSERVINNSIVY